MDLVEEEDRGPAVGLPALACPGDHGTDLGSPGIDSGLFLERAVGMAGDYARKGRLPRSRRPVEDRTVRVAAFDRAAQGRSLA
jgi:hypothetical protein